MGVDMGTASVDSRKRELRAHFKGVRKDLGEDGRAKADRGIEVNLASLPEFEDAEVLLAYLDFGPEVRTRGIIRAAWDASKTASSPWSTSRTRRTWWR